MRYAVFYCGPKGPGICWHGDGGGKVLHHYIFDDRAEAEKELSWWTENGKNKDYYIIEIE